MEDRGHPAQQPALEKGQVGLGRRRGIAVTQSPAESGNALFSNIENSPRDFARPIENGPDQQRNEEQPSKRPRLTRPDRMSYPRRRALAACQPCRVRKTKCDNENPICGACARLGAPCIYTDQSKDVSTYDSASIAILERVNYAISLLETQRNPAESFTEILHDISMQARLSSDVNQDLFFPEFDLGLGFDHSHETYLIENDIRATLDSIDLPVHHTSSLESVLEWPIFNGRYSRHPIEAALFDVSAIDSVARGSGRDETASALMPGPSSVKAKPRSGRGVQEDDVIQLTERFLLYEHIKNPVFDPIDLRERAENVAEDGFRWNEDSCLLLIVCALGTISGPFLMENTVPTEITSYSLSDNREYAAAEAYYTACRKRVGFLGNSVLSIQCMFLIGVYEMYTLRPFTAWLSFHRACVTFQTYLCAKAKQSATTVDSSRNAAETRLYWSCLKSECELRLEIDVPPSGLAKIESLPAFPTPPETSSSRAYETPQSSSQQGRMALSTEVAEPNVEKSWFYYLAEIAIRQMTNRLTNAMYKIGAEAWLSQPLSQMVHIAHELEAQVSQWCQHIPSMLSPDSATNQSDELTYLLHGRAGQFRLKLYQPFLFRIIHTNLESQEHGPQAPAVQEFALKCVGECFERIFAAPIKHRHHGTWFQGRDLLLRAILILAAVKSKRVQVPPNWREAIDRSKTFLHYWDRESCDFKVSIEILKNIFQDVLADEGVPNS